jgi:hypothetical protein
MSATTMTAVSVRFQPATRRVPGISQAAAAAMSVLLLSPAAMIALVFGLWRLGQDLGWTANFLISQGLFSHSVVWIALSVGLKTTSHAATRGTEPGMAADLSDQKRI